MSVCLELQNVIEPTQAVIWARATVDTTGTAISESCCIFIIPWHLTECFIKPGSIINFRECMHKEDLDYQECFSY